MFDDLFIFLCILGSDAHSEMHMPDAGQERWPWAMVLVSEMWPFNFGLRYAFAF